MPYMQPALPLESLTRTPSDNKSFFAIITISLPSLTKIV